MATDEKTCPVCRSAQITEFAEMEEAPVHCNILWRTRQSALSARTGRIVLALCGRCGHIFNKAFDPDSVRYTHEYENSLHFSPCFQDYAKDLAANLIKRYDLHDKLIIEIGCGNGEFLTMLSELGGNSGVGFDTSYARERKAGNEEAPGKLVFIQDLYSERYSEYKGDMICSRQVLEHIYRPREFMEKLRSSIGGRAGTLLFVEVPNVLHTIMELAVWDIIYEHCSYFSPASLARLLGITGFKVLRVDEGFKGQFLCLEAAPGLWPAAGGNADAGPGMDALKKAIMAFSGRYAKKLALWKAQLEDYADRGLTTVLWGGGSKGVSFLNALKVTGQIRNVVDINPHKQGKFIPCTGHEIVGPETLASLAPDSIIVMNPNYIGEIRQSIRGMGLKSAILTA